MFDPKEITSSTRVLEGVICHHYGVTLIAHLSDTHVLEPGHASRSAARRMRLSFLSVGRVLDASERYNRLLSALRAADRARADHVVITGDLTEDGDEAQFEVFAKALRVSGIHPARISLVPGNHDAYDSPGAYERALAGPLDRWQRTSTPGQLVEVDDVVFLPLSTAIHQKCWMARGAILETHLSTLEDIAPKIDADQTLVVLQHHPPSRRAPVLHAFEGLRDHARLGAVLHGHRVHVLHGHTHIPADKHVKPNEGPRIFCAPAVVDNEKPLRLYRAYGGQLVPVDDRASTPLCLPVFAPSPA